MLITTRESLTAILSLFKPYPATDPYIEVTIKCTLARMTDAITRISIPTLFQ